MQLTSGSLIIRAMAVKASFHDIEHQWHVGKIFQFCYQIIFVRLFKKILAFCAVDHLQKVGKRAFMKQREHGGNSDLAALRLNCDVADILDLSTGISPIVYPAGNIRAECWNRLPTHSQLEQCLLAARRAYDVPNHLDIMAGSGTQSLLQFIPKLIVPNGPVWIEQPSYNEHCPAWEAAGHQAITRTDKNISVENCKSFVFVAPNNPTGDDNRARIIEVAYQCGVSGGLVLIDGAFAMPKDADSLAASLIHSLGNQPNVIHLRSFGKFFGMAGLRLGFAIGAPELINQLSEDAGPWAVSSVALKIGAGALDDTLWQQQHERFLTAQSKRLREMLQNAGLPIRGGTALFQTIQHKAAHNLHDHLAADAILTRKYSNWQDLLRFGLPANDVEFERLEKTINNWRQ